MIGVDSVSQEELESPTTTLLKTISVTCPLQILLMVQCELKYFCYSKPLQYVYPVCYFSPVIVYCHRCIRQAIRRHSCNEIGFNVFGSRM